MKQDSSLPSMEEVIRCVCERGLVGGPGPRLRALPARRTGLFHCTDGHSLLFHSIKISKNPLRLIFGAPCALTGEKCNVFGRFSLAFYAAFPVERRN